MTPLVYYGRMNTQVVVLLVLLMAQHQVAGSFSPRLPSGRFLHCKCRESWTAMHVTRRDYLRQMVAAITVATLLHPVPVRSAETIGKADDCNDSFCLGVWDGLLADCPHTINDFMQGAPMVLRSGAVCVSSQDDTPGIFSEP